MKNDMQEQHKSTDTLNSSGVSDCEFIFNIIENMLIEQEKNVINYMNESMTLTEKVRHGDNIWGHLIKAQGALAEIRMIMLADGRKFINTTNNSMITKDSKLE